MKKNLKTDKNIKENKIIQELKDLYDFMNQNNLDSIEFADANKHIKLAKKKTINNSTHQIPVFAPNTANTNTPNNTQSAPVMEKKGETIKSSISGIFYRAPTPSSPPYVREGDTVKAEQILCIIEAMKVFNEIKANFDCKIIKVLVENGKPLSSNQDMFLIEKV